MAKDSGTEQWIHFNKALGENEKRVFYSYLKNQRNFLTNLIQWRRIAPVVRSLSLLLSLSPKFYWFILSVIHFDITGSSLLCTVFPSCSKWELLCMVVCGLTALASLVTEHRLWAQASVVVGHGLSCSSACGILPDQGSNPCPLRWQVDFYPPDHQGSPGSLS